MKLNHLFAGMLALTTVVVSSCSAPRYAQQGTNDDDVYNSNAQAKIYTPAPVRQTQTTDDQYNEDDYYGTSDPYYDMDYSSRINRFYYSSPFRDYYDPYYGGGWYSPGFSLGFGYSPFYNNYWNSPYSGWGFAYSPFWGYNNWGWDNYYYGGGYYGGGFFGGGYYGGGYYGGGYYTGRTTNAPDYRSRPSIGRENGIGGGRTYGSRTAAMGSRTDASGRVSYGRSRGGDRTVNPDGTTSPRTDRTQTSGGSRPSRTDNPRPVNTDRPARESYTPPARQQPDRPSYNPPSRTESGGGGRTGGGSYGGGGGGGSRPTRAGRG